MRSPHVRLRAAAVAALVLLAVGVCRRVAATRSRRARPRRRTARWSGRDGIVVVQVNGLLDPPNAALITKSLRDAERARASLVVVPARRVGRGRRRTSTRSCGRSTRLAGSGRGVGRAVGRRSARRERAARARGVVRVGRARRAHRPGRRRIDFGHPHAPARRAAARARVATARRDDRRDLDHRLSGKDRGRRQDRSTAPSRRSVQFIVGLNGKVLHTATGDVRMSTSTVVGVGTNRQVQANQSVALPQARSHPAARAHARHAVGRVLPVRRRARADAARVLHGQCRHRGRRRRGRARRRLLRLLAPPGRAVGDRAAGARHVRARDRPAGRRARSVDVHRRRVAHRGFDLVVRRRGRARSGVVDPRARVRCDPACSCCRA